MFPALKSPLEFLYTNVLGDELDEYGIDTKALLEFVATVSEAVKSPTIKLLTVVLPEESRYTRVDGVDDDEYGIDTKALDPLVATTSEGDSPLTIKLLTEILPAESL